MKHPHQLSLFIATCLAYAASNANAFALIENDKITLNADVEIALGTFDIDKNFNGKPNSSAWQEGYAKYGFSGQWHNITTVYGAINAVSSATWGDGDPGGLTMGNERRTKFEDIYLGWRVGKELPGMDRDVLDISAGRRVITIGDGFIINDDGLNMGNGIDPLLNRGGAYYLAARHAFHKTATISFSLSKNLNGDLIYIKSDNRAAAKTGMYIANVEYSADIGNVGFTWIHGQEVDAEFADDFQMQREGMNVYSLRGTSSAGIDNLFLSFELARQYRDQITGGTHTGFKDNATAGYTEIGWTFPDIRLSPIPTSATLTYRYSRYGETWDSLFSGLNRGFGTWFQGEVAANYAGPFNSNTRIHHFGVKIIDSFSDITLGLLYFDFNPINDASPNLGGRELDVYAEWTWSHNITFIPMLGLYRPDKEQSKGGVQQGSGTNLYSQLMLVVNF